MYNSANDLIEKTVLLTSLTYKSDPSLSVIRYNAFFQLYCKSIAIDFFILTDQSGSIIFCRIGLISRNYKKKDFFLNKYMFQNFKANII